MRLLLFLALLLEELFRVPLLRPRLALTECLRRTLYLYASRVRVSDLYPLNTAQHTPQATTVLYCTCSIDADSESRTLRSTCTAPIKLSMLLMIATHDAHGKASRFSVMRTCFAKNTASADHIHGTPRHD